MQISTKTGVVQAILSSSPNSENIETPLAASQVPGEIPATGFDIGSGKTHHEGNIDGNFSAGLHNTPNNPITPIDPGEDIDKDRANVAVQQKQPEATRSGEAPPPTSRAGLPPACFILASSATMQSSLVSTSD